MSLESIKTLVNELTTLHVTRGIQPSDLIDNVFDDVYVESSFRKKPEGMIFEITFLEVNEDEPPTKVTMRYTYDLNRHLMLVEQKVAAKKFITQWDRTSSIQERIEKLEALLTKKLPRYKISAILSTMPKDFIKAFPRLTLVA